MKQCKSLNGAVATTVYCDQLTLVDDVLFFPMLHVVCKPGDNFRVSSSQEIQCAPGEDDTESISGIRRILFHDANVVARIRPLHQVGKVQSRRTGTDDGDRKTHATDASSRSFSAIIALSAFLS